MVYRCKREGCGMSSGTRGGLSCARCDAGLAHRAGFLPVYTAHPVGDEVGGLVHAPLDYVGGGGSWDDSSSESPGGD